jgi:lysophospholipase L1-like esterase
MRVLALILILASSASASASPSSSRLNEPSWRKRFEAITTTALKGEAEVVFLGDSITRGWKDTLAWKKYFARYHSLNAGISSDRAENLLWRIQNGNLGNLKPRVAILLIGANNLSISTPKEVSATINAIINTIHTHSPATNILLLGVLPIGKEQTDPRRKKIIAVNQQLELLGSLPRVYYRDFGEYFLEKDGTISKEVMYNDYIHLTELGYETWAKPLAKLIEDKLYKSP